jgi:enamine deaminase RidA (YjgF/YER057c/UK114 family)
VIERHGSGAPWEAVVGYSRVVVAGPFVEVAGTTAPEAGDSAYEQTKATLEKVRVALEGVGCTFADVVRTRIYVTDISQWESYGRAHGEVFGNARPVTAMVEVSALIDPTMLVEIEVTAYRGGSL